MKLVLDFPIQRLRGAPYNPRAIDADAIERLANSIGTIGFAKPIIVCEDGLTVAGHQRTRAARQRGMEAVPAWVLKSVTTGDETRFNQLHNGTDLDNCNTPVFVPVDEPGVFVDVPASEISGDLRSQGAIVRTAICKLITQYGPWGCAVVGPTGEVISSPQYALACLQLGIPCRAYRVPAGTEQAARSAFAQSYGVFSYDHIQRQTWLQTYAQMFRLREGGGIKGGRRSALYEDQVLPSLQRHERLLDFGCGQGDYLKKLRTDGFSAFGVEFFHRQGNAIDVRWTHRMIDEVIAELTQRGRFDVVVLDSVLNSVVNREAESDVLTVVNAMTKPGGRVYFSSRRRERIEQLLQTTSAEELTNRSVEFLDKDGFSGYWYRDGWFFQHFHTDAEGVDLASKWFGSPPTSFSKGSSSWQVATVKNLELQASDVEASLRREFDLPWPDGSRVGRADQIVAAWRSAVARDCSRSE